MSALPAPRPDPAIEEQPSQHAAPAAETLQRGHDLADALLAAALSERTDGQFPTGSETEAFSREDAARLDSMQREIDSLRDENERLAAELAMAVQSLRDEMARLQSGLDSVRASAAQADELARQANEALDTIRTWAVDKIE